MMKPLANYKINDTIINMITQKDREKIQEIYRKYKVKRALLFGSSIYTDKNSNDIDIAVEGVNPKDFFKFYGELIFSLSKPVDIVDLAETSKFVRLIQKEGIPVYG